jgi:type II secretory pathway pseudopilin PulG
MSTGLIIAIVVVVLLLLLALVVLLPRARARKRERELQHRRGEVAEAHRDRAERRSARADEAEQVAARERAEADLHETRARMHERGLADDDLDAERERVVQGGSGNAGDRDRSSTDADAGDRDRSYDRGDSDSGDAGEFERGRAVGHDEAEGGAQRFERGTTRDERT